MQDLSGESDEPRSIDFGRHNTNIFHQSSQATQEVAQENDTVILLDIVQGIIKKIGTKPTIDVLRHFLNGL